ncbi:MAG: carboxy-S-adenosyl-L-methionine synthase CmoA [Halobacteriovoraceae bacterium]|nr:carboxy-S-adenosyl-L-methionine synthase CmoA [Halobacteriovoraceae bacterium]
MKDKVFADRLQNIAPFEFNESVASVFDDMVQRSIPFYQEIHQLIMDLVVRQYRYKGKIVDLGCSTGTTISMLEIVLTENRSDQEAQFVGIDTSAPMLEKAKEKCAKVKNVQFIHGDMTEYNFEQTEIVILNYTLQFLKHSERIGLLKKIYDSLLPGGIILLSEKIQSPQAPMQEIITDLYYDFKRRNGYSELEISQKREALENVLVPVTPKEQLEMLDDAGFDYSEMLFRWYNFASYIGMKKEIKS